MQTAWVAASVPHVHDDSKRLDGSSIALSYMSVSISTFLVIATHGRGCSGNGPLSPDAAPSFSNSMTWPPPPDPFAYHVAIDSLSTDDATTSVELLD
uniref:Uncharacterized protein n=1 Tax=Oryza meridionalis TaxID=40149 RepID=A0A0E0DY79_9ORYZ